MSLFVSLSPFVFFLSLFLLDCKSLLARFFREVRQSIDGFNEAFVATCKLLHPHPHHPQINLGFTRQACKSTMEMLLTIVPLLACIP